MVTWVVIDPVSSRLQQGSVLFSTLPICDFTKP